MKELYSLIIDELRVVGFKPELNSTSLYIKSLEKYLGVKKANKLLHRIDHILNRSMMNESVDVELEISKLVGADEGLLKLIYSTGISKSVEPFIAMIEIITQLGVDPKHLIDLGGANGWGSNYLKSHFNWVCQVTIVDRNKTWKTNQLDLKIINVDYESFTAVPSVDLAISIFGAPYDNIEALIGCASRSLSQNGYFISVLRIVNEDILKRVIVKASKDNLGYLDNYQRRAESDGEYFYLTVFQKL